MDRVHYNQNSIILNGEEIFLYSGEFHYFRTDPTQWADSLEKMKDAHLNCVSIYVPWNWHEKHEGHFDFKGETHPKRDLLSALDLIQDMGFYIIFRPGPFICSEWLYGGYPEWLYIDYPETRALDRWGNPHNLDMLYPPLTYLHPTFLSFARRWYQQLLIHITPLTYPKGGKIIAWQIDDEPSYGWATRAFDPFFADYNPIVVGKDGLYQSWLSRRYDGDIEDSPYRLALSFEAVTAPHELPDQLGNLLPYQDWHAFKVDMTFAYLEAMYNVLEQADLGIPISVLYPVMLPYTASRAGHYFAIREKPVIITSQCYPGLFGAGFVAEGIYGHVAALTQLVHTWNKPLGAPPMSAEIQGSLSAHISPEGMESYYAWSIAQGLNGVNFYMMAGGDNPAGFHKQTARSYDISAPIGAAGELRPHYPVIQRLGRFLETHGNRLVRTQPIYDIGVGFYAPYESAAQQGDTLKMHSRDHYEDVLHHYFGLHHGCVARTMGLFSLLSATGLTYAMCDLENATLDELIRYPQLWVLGLDFMAREVQEKLCAYVRMGGHLVLMPRVPQLDENFQRCNILGKMFPSDPIDPQPGTRFGARRMNFHTFSTPGLAQGVLVTDYLDTFHLPEGTEALAFDDRSGKPCAYKTSFHNGTASLLGFKLTYEWDGRLDHKHFIDSLVEDAGVHRSAWAEGWELFLVQRVAQSEAEGSFLFVVNPTPWPQCARLHYKDEDGFARQFPEVLDGIHFQKQGGLILFLDTPIAGSDARVIYSTAQIQAWNSKESTMELELYAHPNTPVEIQLLLPQGFSKATVDGQQPSHISWEPDQQRLTLVYQQTEQVVSLIIRSPL